MAEILPETDPCSVASLNKRLCGWEASASDENREHLSMPQIR